MTPTDKSRLVRLAQQKGHIVGMTGDGINDAPALKAADVPTARYYPIPMHLLGATEYLGYRKGDMPVSEACAADIFALPMHPYLKAEDIDRICGVIADTVKA